MIRILIADDHALVRAGLSLLLQKLENIEVSGEASDGLEAVKLAHSLAPDIVLMDIAMPGLNGLEAALRISKECPSTQVILLSMFGSEAHLRKALQAGASGYLLKGADLDELGRAIRTVYSGNTYLMPEIANHAAEVLKTQTHPTASAIDRLTSRQREVLQLIVEGLSAKDIALRLGLSTKTVDAHRSQVMQRLGIFDIPGLVRFALRSGLIQDTPQDFP